MNASDSHLRYRFKPGDIIRAVRGLSVGWTLRVPLRVVAVSDWSLVVESVDGGPFMTINCAPWVRTADCELDVFLNAAHRAVKDA